MKKNLLLVSFAAIAMAASAQDPVEVTLTPYMPSSFNLTTNQLSMMGGGLAYVVLNTDATVTKNTDCTGKIQMYKNDALAAEAAVGDEEIFVIMSSSEMDPGSPLAEGDDIDAGGTVDTPDMGASMIAIYPGFTDAAAAFYGAGVFKFVIPAGAMKTADGALTKAIELTYTVTEKIISGDVSYSFTPAETEVVSDLKEISLTLDGTYIMYGGSCKVTLEFPNGTTLSASYPTLSAGFVNGEKMEASYGDSYANTLTWTFGKANTVWVEGEYTLTIPAGKINVNDLYWDEYETKGNFPGCTGKWTLSTKTGVIGIFGDAAEYNVYGTDGAPVILNGTAADVKTLAKGVYVINGRTFIIK